MLQVIKITTDDEMKKKHFHFGFLYFYGFLIDLGRETSRIVSDEQLFDLFNDPSWKFSSMSEEEALKIMPQKIELI